MLLKIYSFEEILFIFCIFLVRGIVDNIKEIINNKVIPIRPQNVRLDNSNSPNETVRYKFNFKRLINFVGS
mgnify:FL=1